MFVLIGIGLMFDGSVDMVRKVIAAFAVIFFAACCMYAMFRLVKPRPAVVIDQNGIEDNATAFGVGFLAWHEIAEMREFTSKGQTFLGIVPKDLDALLARQPRWKRAAIRFSLLTGGAPVNIPQTILPTTVSVLLRLIDRRFHRVAGDHEAGHLRQLSR